MRHLFLLVWLFTIIYCKKLLIPANIRIKLTSISKCSTHVNYSLNVFNVTIQYISSKMVISGTLETNVDLMSPIKAVTKLEHKVWGIWVPVPVCDENFGTCTYNDLCNFGYPSNKTCPQQFLDNNVPCRCPIQKGNYTFAPPINLFTTLADLYSGKYYMELNVTNSRNLLACYNIYFELSDSLVMNENLEQDVNDVNNRPNVIQN